MADANSTTGLSIPGSARRKKAYSVSLHENNFDISEVPCMQDEVVSLEGDGNLSTIGDKCNSCGQNIPPKVLKDNDAALGRTPVSNSPVDFNSSRIGTPAELQPVSTASRFIYLIDLIGNLLAYCLICKLLDFYCSLEYESYSQSNGSNSLSLGNHSTNYLVFLSNS